MNKRKMKRLLYLEVGYPMIDHLDHVNKKNAIVSFAYNFNMNDVKAFVQFCEKYNLKAVFSYGYEYGNGSTIEIEITDKV